MSKHIYIIAGEASGDFLGAQLMKAIKAKDTDIKFSGVGGALMKNEGLKSLFPMHDLSVMGIVEVLPRLKLLIKLIRQTSDNIDDIKPDVVITIDAPDFCFRVIKRVKKISSASNKPFPKFIHYVAPTVWAWRPKRAQKIAQFLDGLICLFDFEPAYFEKEGLSAITAGHPMMESGVMEARALFIGQKETPKLGVFFGSRQGEIKRIAPVLIETLNKIIVDTPDIELVIPTLPHLETQILELTQDINNPVHIYTDQSQKWSVFKACDAAIAVSGTVGLELAAANVPHVIAYKTNRLTWEIAKRLIKTPYAHLANIIMGKEVVPEFIQDDCDAADIANEVLTLLDDQSIAQMQRKEFDFVRQSIGYGVKTPSEIAAEFVLEQM